MTHPRTLADTAAAEVRAEIGRQRTTLAAVAQALGVNPMYLSRRLSGGERSIPLDLADLERIAEVLSVPVAQLLPGVAQAGVDAA